LTRPSIAAARFDPVTVRPDRMESPEPAAIASWTPTCPLSGDQDAAVSSQQNTEPKPKPRSPSSFTQVYIGNRPIVQMPNALLASQFARQIEQVLQDPSFDADQIQPTRVNGRPAGQIGDRVLFAMPSNFSQDGVCNADQFTIQWINRLRLALGGPPLAFAQAQALLYDLREGPKRLQLRASWYGPYFHGRQTATGDLFNQHEFTAAHPSLPFDTYLKVTNPRSGKSVIVQINDRGPYVGDRNLDLSWEAARAIDSEHDGVVSLEAVIMQPQPSRPRPGLELANL
jgi:rare lipoprotein A